MPDLDNLRLVDWTIAIFQIYLSSLPIIVCCELLHFIKIITVIHYERSETQPEYNKTILMY